MAHHHPAIDRLKISSRNKELASSLLRSFRHQGLPAKQAIEIATWASKQQGDLLQAFIETAPAKGWNVDAGLNWHSAVSNAGGSPEAILPLPPLSPAAIAEQLAQVKHIQQNDFARWERDIDLQDHQLELMQMQAEAEQPAAQAPASNVYSPAAPAPSAASGAARLAEIAQMRRDPFNSGYDFNRAIQAEELALIEASMPRETAQPANKQSIESGSADSSAPASAPAVSGNGENI